MDWLLIYGLTIDWWIDYWLMDWLLIDWWIDCLWLIKQVTDWLGDHLIVWLIEWLINWLILLLPSINYCVLCCIVIIALLLCCRVSKNEDKNKMTLKNLATVFGPTLLRPAARHSQTQTMEQLFFLSAHEAMLQTTILLHFMNLRSNGVEFKRNA